MASRKVLCSEGAVWESRTEFGCADGARRGAPASLLRDTKALGANCGILWLVVVESATGRIGNSTRTAETHAA